MKKNTSSLPATCPRNRKELAEWLGTTERTAAAQLKNYERNRAEAQEMARKGDFIGARNKLNAIFQAQWQELAE